MLVVSTHLTNMLVKIGSFPQVWVKNNNMYETTTYRDTISLPFLCGLKLCLFPGVWKLTNRWHYEHPQHQPPTLGTIVTAGTSPKRTSHGSGSKPCAWQLLVDMVSKLMEHFTHSRVFVEKSMVNKSKRHL